MELNFAECPRSLPEEWHSANALLALGKFGGRPANERAFCQVPENWHSVNLTALQSAVRRALDKVCQRR